MTMTKKASTKKSDLRARIADLQQKAKSTAALATSIVKDNAGETVETGKLLAGGLKEIGSVCVADTRGFAAKVSADLGAVAKSKSVKDAIALQREQAKSSISLVSTNVRKNFASLQELLAGKVAPKVKARIAANIDLLKVKKAA